MPRVKNSVVARRENLTKAREAIERNETIERPVFPSYPRKIPAKLLAYAIIVEGGSYQQIVDILAHCGIRSVCPTAYSAAQKKVGKILEQMGIMSLQKWRNCVKSGSVMCIDGGWDHKRDGKHCIVSVIDNKNWKIIDIEILKRGKELDDTVNYVGSATNMESEGVTRIIKRFNENEELRNKFIAFCHDCDGRVRAIFRKLEWDLRELLDINHAMLSFQKSFKNINGQNEKRLDGLYFKLKLWTYHVIEMNADTETKVSAFMNAADHYTGNHLHCDHDDDVIDFESPLIDDPKTYEVLVEFLEANKYIVEQCDPIANTQHNESFNNTRARMALKTIAWKESFRARTWVAVLETNEFDRDWKSELREKLNIPPLPEAIQSYFDNQMEKKLKRSAYRHTEEYQKEERLRRLAIKKTYQTFNKTEPGYNIEHEPGWHMNDEIFSIFESLSDDKFKDFIRTQKEKKTNKLEDFINAFVCNENFEDHRKYMKKFIHVAKVCFSANISDIFQLYDKFYVNKLENITVNETAYAEMLRKQLDAPTFATESATKLIKQYAMLDAPSEDVKFVLKRIEIDHKRELRYLYPHCKTPDNAVLDVDGVIIAPEEREFYHQSKVHPFANADLYFAPRQHIDMSCSWNCELILCMKNGSPHAFLHKPEKRINPETGRCVKFSVKAGEVVLLPFY